MRHAPLISRLPLQLLATLIAVTATLAMPEAAQALELDLSVGSLHQPNSSYHYLSGQVELGLRLGEGNNRLAWQLGATPPYAAHSMAQMMFFSSLHYLFEAEDTGFRFFGGGGFGAWLDWVNTLLGWTVGPTLIGGIKWGGPGFGVSLALNVCLGLGQPYQLPSGVIWALSTGSAGVYFAF